MKLSIETEQLAHTIDLARLLKILTQQKPLILSLQQKTNQIINELKQLQSHLKIQKYK